MSANEKLRGFVLQPTYRTTAEGTVVHLFGVLETGESFLLTDDRNRPYFYVESKDLPLLRNVDAEIADAPDRETLLGRPASRIEVRHPADAPPLRDRLHQQGIATYEADVRFAMRYLIERGIRGALHFEHFEESDPAGGPRRELSSVEGLGRPRHFHNPEVAACDWSPQLKVLSLDIETDPRIRRVLSVGLWGCGAEEVILVTPDGFASVDTANCVPTEAALLRTLAQRIRQLDPDVIIGWNVADFDFTVLERRARELGVLFELGRAPGHTRIRKGQGRAATQVGIPGRVVLDGPTLILGSAMRMERLGLDFVGRQVLGTGKTHVGGDQHAQDILDWFRNDREKLVRYNLQDARIALEILEQLELIELAVERSRLTGMPLDRVAASVASFDFLYLSELGARGIVAQSLRAPGTPDRENFEPMAGGHLLPMVTGLHENVLLLDFKSLYPSLMRTFHIDPLGYARAGNAAIEAPNGARFRNEPGILGGLLDQLMPARERAKEQGNTIASQAIKILMNSFYGVLGTTSCRFFDPALANAITGFGKELLLWTRDALERRGLEVLYGDTDSVFVASGTDAEAARLLGDVLAAALTEELREHLAEAYGVESKLELEFECLYLKLFLPHVRSGTAGAAKRYAGLIDDGDEGRIDFKGLEAVRRDWTDFAREAQHHLYERFFRARPVAPYLRETTHRLRSGDFDDKLIYRKALRKKLTDYTATTPPHVAAARKATKPPGRLIAYVMTAAGPEPAEEQQSPFDYQHYLDKQLQPIAEPLLEIEGLDFKKVIGDDRQLELF
ncbi:MAG: DNA polymerase II [Acidobacteriota bacterium]